MKITKKQQIRNDIDRILNNEPFITWEMLHVDPYSHDWRYSTYDAKVVFAYMEEKNVEYVRYSNVHFTGKKYHGNCKGFFNDIAKRRKRKIQQINNSIKKN